MNQIDKLLYTAKTHTTGATALRAAPMDVSTSSCHPTAPLATEPIRSNCSPPAGPPASSARWESPPAR
jgi:hypothetical protein